MPRAAAQSAFSKLGECHDSGCDKNVMPLNHLSFRHAKAVSQPARGIFTSHQAQHGCRHYDIAFCHRCLFVV